LCGQVANYPVGEGDVQWFSPYRDECEKRSGLALDESGPGTDSRCPNMDIPLTVTVECGM
jgi:hypothetical protein